MLYSFIRQILFVLIFTRKFLLLVGKGQGEQLPDESRNFHPGTISVEAWKLDELMDLVGELVHTEAMVTQNPELKPMQLDRVHQAARRLREITGEMRDKEKTLQKTMNTA